MIDLSDVWPEQNGLIEILVFKHSNENRKLRNPLQCSDILVSCPGKQLPDDFCKKNLATELVKRFRCNACHCLIESVSALKEHGKGNKHIKNVTTFDPFAKRGGTEKRSEKAGSQNRKRKPNLSMSLKEILIENSFPVVGLDHVQEFRHPGDSGAIFMYKCMLYKCDGAWGHCQRFVEHLTSMKHLRSFFEKQESQKDALISKVQILTDEELENRGKQLLIDDGGPKFEDVQVIMDEERYWIQANRNKKVGSIFLNTT